jgi:diguanylate cyclase (GGDEF)-like protein
LPKFKEMAGPPASESYRRDPLTGLPDERLFRQQLPLEFARARDRERNAALLAVRLDGIEALNDRFGRASGDEALLAVASVLVGVRAGEGRQAHLLFKLAGSLFGYYLPEASAAQARGLAEAIHEKVQQSEAFLQPLTVSIGIVNFYEFFLEEGSREELAQRVRQTALYRVGIAERQGANTICDSSEISAAAVAGRPTVLLVDPDPDSMELLVRALEAAELRVQVHRDGESALAAVLESPPAAIVCEAMCPRINGFAVRERLRTNALWSSIPFILVSHRKNEDLIRKAVERDIRHFFRKPVSLTEVAGLLVNLTRRPAGPAA